MTQPAAPRIVVVTADLGGNVPPALGIAAKLMADGAAVHVIGHRPQEAAVTSLGLPFTAYTRGRAYDALQPRSGPATILGLAGLFCDQGVATDLLELAAVHRADLLLVDCMLLGALAAGTRSGIPTVALVHSLPEFFTGRWSHGPIGMLAGLRGLRPAKVWGGLAGAVTATLPELAGSTTALGGPVVGPVWQGAPGGGTRLAGRPKVLVSLSTIWWPGQDAVAQRVLDALSGLDVDAVITTGPAVDPAPLTAPPNVELRRWADHGKLDARGRPGHRPRRPLHRRAGAGPRSATGAHPDAPDGRPADRGQSHRPARSRTVLAPQRHRRRHPRHRPSGTHRVELPRGSRHPGCADPSAGRRGHRQ